MLARNIWYSGKRYVPTSIYIPRRNIQNVTNSTVTDYKTDLPEQGKKQPGRKPFLKNLFLGRVDCELLTFPEPQSDDRYKEFFEWIKPIEHYVSMINRNEVSGEEAFKKLKELDVLRSKIDAKYGGLNLSETEIFKILETVGSVSGLATSLVKNNIMPVELISKFGSDTQKEKYLPQIGNGDILPTVCITEMMSGPNVKNIETKAEYSPCGEFWILNGKKVFVANGKDCNLFIVLANFKETDMLSAFIVEHSHGNITCSDVLNTIHQHQNMHVCTIDFKDVRIPKENLLGNISQGRNILTEALAPGRNKTAGAAIGLLRHFVSLLNENILKRRHLDKNMYEYESIQAVVGNITSILYSMESVAYFTNTMDDLYDNQDLELERVVTETYCVNECVKQIHKGLQVIGVEGYLKDSPYIHLYQEALGLSIFDGSAIDEQIYIALLGLQYTGSNIHVDISKKRNYLQYPGHIIKGLFSNIRSDYLFDYFHLSFKTQSEVIEKCIQFLSVTTEGLLTQYGSEVSSKQVTLQRLAEIAILTYVSIAVVSRASRSYCIGVRNAELERYVSMHFIQHVHKEMEALKNDLRGITLNFGDELLTSVAEAVFKNKGYIFENPLKRTH